MYTSRRSFLKISTVAGSGLMLPQSAFSFLKENGHDNETHQPSHQKNDAYLGDELLDVSYDLIKRWGSTLLTLQINNPALKGLHGGIMCQSCGMIHGRCGDTVLPFLFLAEKTGEQKYIKAALDVYEWMEGNVSMPDGSWVNDVTVSSWKGITVFTSISLVDSLTHFGHLLDSATKAKWENRFRKACDYIYKEFDIHYGNINYPITASYALTLAGKYFNDQKFTDRGRELAHNALQYFTPKDGLLFGEGHPVKDESPKGCYSVDLGYNVEESLPALVLYAKLANDTEVLDAVTRSLKAHMEFMLPDGAWDNSWGTRNYKWTYWGSRTSDGCQPAYALMADKDPAFYKVALQNTKLLNACTHNNILYGGPHYVSHHVLPCVHHMFGHSKALITILLSANQIKRPTTALVLPREKTYGVKAFADVQTWLIAKNGWRGTVTGFDQEYSVKGGHASGGALTLLWHAKTGAIIAGSMTNYQLVEDSNMQRDKDEFSMSLTPRFEIEKNKKKYTNINDLKSATTYKETDKEIIFTSQSDLVDENQVAAIPGSPSACETEYTFTDDACIIKAKCLPENANEKARFVLPIISASNEKVTVISPYKLQIQKNDCILHIEANSPIKILETTNGRIFNFVPGMEAIPLELANNDVEVKIHLS
jgi:hypothetical protein